MKSVEIDKVKWCTALEEEAGVVSNELIIKERHE